uniref:Uncharacterized protein n=1 Tax=Salmo trutta TaxID=8032 RepID=A0A673WWV4_SALTR
MLLIVFTVSPCSTNAKVVKKGGGAKGKKVTLKMAKKAVRVTAEGCRRLDLSNMGIAIFPKCLLKTTSPRRAVPQAQPTQVATRLNLLFALLPPLPHMYILPQLPQQPVPRTLTLYRPLWSFNLGMNFLDTLPPTTVGLCSIHELRLFDNLFPSLPEFIKVLLSITRLNTKRNPFSYTQGNLGEKSLCGSYLKRYGGERDAEGRSGLYSRLITFNPLAQVNQKQWRSDQSWPRERFDTQGQPMNNWICCSST